jgi:putative effector of murein hydrolase
VALVTDHITAVDTISVVTVFLAGVCGLSAEAQASRALRTREEVAMPQAVRA